MYIYKLYIYKVYKVFEQSGEKNLNDDSRKWNEYIDVKKIAKMFIEAFFKFYIKLNKRFIYYEIKFLITER